MKDYQKELMSWFEHISLDWAGTGKKESAFLRWIDLMVIKTMWMSEEEYKQNYKKISEIVRIQIEDEKAKGLII